MNLYKIIFVYKIYLKNKNIIIVKHLSEMIVPHFIVFILYYKIKNLILRYNFDRKMKRRLFNLNTFYISYSYVSKKYK